MKNYLQFWDRCIIDETCYFSYVKYNSLFKENLLTNKVDHIGFFEKEEIHQSMLHRKVFNVEGVLFFIPFQGKGIYEYNIKEKQFAYHLIKSKSNVVSYSNAFLEDKKIYLIPSNEDVDFAIFDCENREIMYCEELWLQIKKCASGTKSFDVCSSVFKDGEMIIVPFGLGDVLRINWQEKSVNCFNLGIGYKFSNIVFQNNAYWFLPLEGNLIISCSDSFNEIKEYFCKNLEVTEKPFIGLVDTGSEIILIPANSDCFWHLSSQGDFFERVNLKLPDDFFEEDSKGIKFLGYEITETENIILYPKRSRYICELSKTLKSIVFRKVEYNDLGSIDSKVKVSVIEKFFQHSEILQEENSDINTLSNYIMFIRDKTN